MNPLIAWIKTDPINEVFIFTPCFLYQSRLCHQWFLAFADRADTDTIYFLQASQTQLSTFKIFCMLCYLSIFGANPFTRQLPGITGVTFNLQLRNIYATIIIIKSRSLAFCNHAHKRNHYFVELTLLFIWENFKK